MASGINKVFLVGNLGTEPELLFKDSDNPKLEFRLATNEPFKRPGSDRWEERTQWHSVTMSGSRAAPLSAILSKGARVVVEGKIHTRDYLDKEGNKRFVTEVRARNIQLEPRSRGEGRERGDVQGRTAAASEAQARATREAAIDKASYTAQPATPIREAITSM